MSMPRALISSFLTAGLLLLPPHRSLAAPPVPVLRVPVAEVDLGTHMAGTPLLFEFKLRNEGKAPLEIQDVKLFCGCMGAEYDRTIPAGREMTLRVKMQTEGREGAVSKPIKVTTNDPAQPFVVLAAKAELLGPIQVIPGKSLEMLLIPAHETVGEVMLQSHEGKPLEITKIETSPGPLRVEAMPPGDDPLVRKLRLTVPAAEKVQPLLASVAVHTNSAARPVITLEVEGLPRGAVRVLPRRVSFEEVYEQPAAPASQLVMLLREAGALKIESVETDSPALTANIYNTEGAPFSEVVVRYNGGWKPGRIEGKLTLKTSDPQSPTLEVPYVAEVRPGKEPGAPEPPAAGARADGSKSAAPKPR